MLGLTICLHYQPFKSHVPNLGNMVIIKSWNMSCGEKSYEWCFLAKNATSQDDQMLEWLSFLWL